jgi:pantetheine-phosphate adenylyltransferase
MSLAIYPGTFDPITLGHVDVAERVARLFDRVLVAVAVGRHKRPGLSVEDRVTLACEALRHVPNVQVEAFDGLIASFAAHRGASVLIRGLRATDNLSEEVAMAVTTRIMIPGLETLFVPSSADLDPVSSTIIREIATRGGKLSDLVPQQAVDRVREGYGS